jgi:hypothetical protein
VPFIYESPHSFFVTENCRNVLNDRYRYVTELTRLILRIWQLKHLQASITSTHRHVHVQIVALGSFLHYS